MDAPEKIIPFVWIQTVEKTLTVWELWDGDYVLVEIIPNTPS